MGSAHPAGNASHIAFEVAQYRVDPSEGGMPTGSPAPRHIKGFMAEANASQEVVGSPSISDDQGTLDDAFLEPRLQGCGADIGENLHHDPGNAVRVSWVSLHSHNKGGLASRTPASLALMGFPAHVGIIHFNAATNDRLLFPDEHYLHELLLQAPGCLIAHAKLSLEFQG